MGTSIKQRPPPQSRNWWLLQAEIGYLATQTPTRIAVHTDRGSQYASSAYRSLAADFGITVSMSRKGNAWDNAPIESFFKTLKVVRIY